MGYYRKLQHEGYLRHLLVRRAVKTGEILVALVTSGQTGKEGMPQSLENRKKCIGRVEENTVSS